MRLDESRRERDYKIDGYKVYGVVGIYSSITLQVSRYDVEKKVVFIFTFDRFDKKYTYIDNRVVKTYYAWTK